MNLSRERLVGRWRKREAVPRESPYPDEVEFFPDGTYRAASQGKRSDWDEAAFDITGDHSLRVETAYDRKANYTATMDGDELTIDDGTHRVTYTRAK